MALDRHAIELDCPGLLFGEPVVLAAPKGTAPIDVEAGELTDPDSPWRVIHPAVPDFPPED